MRRDDKPSPHAPSMAPLENVTERDIKTSAEAAVNLIITNTEGDNMNQQALFDFYTYVLVGVIAQSMIAWELGKKGWSIISPRISLKVTVAILLWAGNIVWLKLAGLEYPIKSLREAWFLIFPTIAFVFARLRLGLRPRPPRLEYFLRAKKLYSSYTRRLDIPFWQLNQEHHRKASDNPSLREVEELLKQAIALSLEEGEEFDVAVAQYHLGMLAHLQGRKDTARQLFEDALTLLSRHISREEAINPAAGCHYHLGLIEEAESNLSDARNHFRQAYELDTSIGQINHARSSKHALERCGGNL